MTIHMDDARPRKRPRPLFRAAMEFAAIAALVVVSRTVVAQPFYVTSGSMEPTLQIGDELLATKFAYGYSRFSLPFRVGPAASERVWGKLPDRGDVVLFHLPRDPAEVYVKRVIGVPGDRVQVRGGHVWLNERKLVLRADGIGQLEEQDGTKIPVPRYVEALPDGREHPVFKLHWSGTMNDTPVFHVPAGHLFVMGDNRDDSLDSRVPAEARGVGFVPVENLIGRADVVIGSWDFPIMREPFWTWVSGLRWSRFFSRIS
jgi:signal peptidase I